MLYHVSVFLCVIHMFHTCGSDLVESFSVVMSVTRRYQASQPPCKLYNSLWADDRLKTKTKIEFPERTLLYLLPLPPLPSNPPQIYLPLCHHFYLFFLNTSLYFCLWAGSEDLEGIGFCTRFTASLINCVREDHDKSCTPCSDVYSYRKSVCPYRLLQGFP